MREYPRGPAQQTASSTIPAQSQAVRAQPHRKQSQHGSKGSETDRRGERAETGKHPTDCAAEAGSDADCDRRDTEVAAEQLWRREVRHHNAKIAPCYW